MGSGTHFTVVEGGELADVETEDGVLSLVEFAGGVLGSLEASRVLVGPHVEISFEVHGTKGALRWDFQRMNELEVFLPLATGDEGFATVFMSPGTPSTDTSSRAQRSP
jgi:predicted dehydrogenase